MKDAQIGEVFLVTTALEEFRDTSKPMVFLGEWCSLYERRSCWDEIDSRLLSSPYDNVDAAAQCLSYSLALDTMSPIFAKQLHKLRMKLNGWYGDLK